MEKLDRMKAAAEKADQVAMMGTIYQKASKTIIWLGPDSQPSEESACRTIKSFEPLRIQMEECAEHKVRAQIRRGEVHVESPSEVNVKTFMMVSHLLTSTPEMLLEEGINAERAMPMLDERAIREVIKLYQREWFVRTWPIQEVVLSKNKVLLCGDSIDLSWEQVGWFAAYFSNRYKNRNMQATRLKVLKEPATYTTTLLHTQQGFRSLLCCV